VLQELRIDVPELEPDPVLLTQLSQLSAASVPHRRDGPVRALVATVTVLVLVGFSWLTGALPGVASPFDGVREHRPAPQHAPRTSPAPDPAPGAAAALPSQPAVLPPGQVKPHHNGQHLGQTEPHQDNGLHLGQTKPHQNNGHHLGQTKPHENNGQHLGQTKPHHSNGHGDGQDNGHHNGQTKPHQDHGNGNGHQR
jgi:hypothetical protein